MTIYAFTSFTYSYLDRARVLSRTLRLFHPDWHLCAVVTDQPPSGASQDALLSEFDSVLTAEDLMDREQNGRPSAWIFGHSIVEACTAVKGRAMAHLLDRPDADKVLFFDPDIAIFSPLTLLTDALDQAQIILTPHQVDPEPRGDLVAIGDNEIASLQYGIFNLGFVGVANRPEGRRFAGWWGDRLVDLCRDDLSRGLFTDQKWANLVPCFFDDVRVLRDPGLNVASWNLSQRQLSFDEAGEILVNGHPLRFFHFTKLGPVGDQMTRRYAHDNAEVLEVWAWYKRAVAEAAAPEVPPGYWHYGTFSNDEPIPPDVRRLYRDRADLRATFSDPFDANGGFFDWLVQHEIVPAATPTPEPEPEDA